MGPGRGVRAACLPLVTASAALVVAACDKGNDGGAPSASASSVLVASAAPSASASAAVSASASTSAVPDPVATAVVDAGGKCGTKPLPDCPMQAWMKANAQKAVAAGDAAAIAAAFDKTATFAPAGKGYANWASIATDGAAAARVGDVDAAKAACRSCHDQYKAKYRSELRTKPIEG